MSKDKSMNNGMKNEPYNEQDLASLIDFLWIVNKRRPYCLSDFVPQTFIPDFSRQYDN